MFHINDSNEAKPCRASAPANCKFYKGEDDARHYDNIGEATVASEKLLQEQHGSLAKAAKYSFVRNFKEQEKTFNEDFDGFPNRFFNADLKGNTTRLNFDGTDPDSMTDAELYLFRHREMAARMFTSTSSTSDMNASGEDIEAALDRLGADEIVEIQEATTLRALGGQRAWMAKFDDQYVAILGNKRGSNLDRYSFKRAQHAPFETGRFVMTDIRTVIGADRAERKTGSELFKKIITDTSQPSTTEARRETVKMLNKLEDAQLEGANFRSQKAHIKEHSGSVATAYMDKKNPDKIRQDLMKNTKLNKIFRKVEIDNDVDPAEFANFEQAYAEVADKLPPIPGDKKPEIRIRKLGKHRATGIFFPHKNTICIDVRDSSAFIHEYGHYVDLIVKDNQSLNEDFRQITKDYSKKLTVPEGLAGRKREYYTTPTEVHSRMFEVYAHERLGIDNRLVNPGRFNDFDYEPITSDADLKKRSFDFFDKVFSKNT